MEKGRFVVASTGIDELVNRPESLVIVTDTRVFEPKTKRRKPLKTLSFGNFGEFRKYKVQKTSPSLI